MGRLLDERTNDPNDRRAFVRMEIYRDALLSIPGHIMAQPCSVRDLSVKGANIRLNGIGLLPVEFEISFDGFRTLQPSRLIWRDGDFAGLLFQSWRSEPDVQKVLIRPT
jgi:hypothetical protein